MEPLQHPRLPSFGPFVCKTNKFPFHLLFCGLLFFGVLAYVVESDTNHIAWNYKFMLESVLESRPLLSQSRVLSDTKHKSLHDGLKCHTHSDLADVLQMLTRSHNTESETPDLS